jgi:UDP-N-acetyl-D-galactosamine dehydrogenase
MIKKDIKVKNANVLVLGFTFKENCPDVRNTKVIDIVTELKTYQLNIEVVDPWAEPAEVYHEYNINTVKQIPIGKTFDAIILAVAHNEFKSLDIASYLNSISVMYDVKGIIDNNLVDGRL